MPPRLSKRQQREQEEIAALASQTPPVEAIKAPSGVIYPESDSDDTPEPISKRTTKPTAGGFSLVSFNLRPHVPFGSYFGVLKVISPLEEVPVQ